MRNKAEREAWSNLQYFSRIYYYFEITRTLLKLTQHPLLVYRQQGVFYFQEAKYV